MKLEKETMTNDRRLIEDFLPIQVISADLPAALRSSAGRSIEDRAK